MNTIIGKGANEETLTSIMAKLRELERNIVREKGPFSLMALFLREEAEDKWDLVVAAPWFKPNKKRVLQYITKQLKSSLSDDELVMLSRIVILAEKNPALTAINRAIGVEGANARLRNCNFFGLQIKDAFVVTSRGQSADSS